MIMVAAAAFMTASVMAAAALMALTMVAAAALVTFTVMAAAALMAFTVMMSMMIAFCIGIVAQAADQEGFHLRIGIPGCTGIKLDTHLGQGIFSAAANAAADESAHLMTLKKADQGAMTAAIGIHNLT